MKKEYYTYEMIHNKCVDVANQITKDNWTPDYVVGITRGGLIPAVIISHLLNTKMHALTVSLRDNPDYTESNSWMSEDAFNGKNILIIDDINDTGNTIKWIKNDWQSSCFSKDTKWNTVWNNNVRFAVLTNNIESAESVYYYNEKSTSDVWIVYPWEVE